MRPLRLELEGFGPYREAQAVDFSDVELFAITGPTGSGKSTLLDAMAFALYGRVPRVGRSVKELKHPAVPEARVRLVFQVGGRVFRVDRVRGRRSEDRLFEILPQGERLLPLERQAEFNERMAQILGLSYEAFTRALLLPQGEFDRFLKGEARERHEILADLFGLALLERARERAAERRLALLEEKGHLEGELRPLEGATLEAKEALEGELQGLRKEIARLTREEGRLAEEAKGAQEALRLLRERHALESWRARLQAEAPAMAALEARLARAAEAERALPLWRDLRAKEEALKGTQGERQGVEARLADLTEARRALAFSPEALRAAREALLEAQELKGLEALWRRVGTQAHPTPRLDPAALEGVLAEEDRLAREAEALRAWARAKARREEEEKALSRLQEELSALEREGKALRAEAERVEGALQAATAHRLKEEVAALRARKEELERERARLERALEELAREERRLGLWAYRDLLEPGKPCPLCGGVVHALPPLGEPSGLALERRSLEGELQALLRRLGALEGELAEKEKALSALPEPLPGDLEALQTTLEGLRERLQTLREGYRELQGKAKAMQEGLARLREEEARLAPKGVEEPEAALQQAERALAALRAEKEALGAGLYRHLQERTGGQGVKAHLEALRAWVKDLEGQEREDQRLSQAIQEAEHRLAALKAKEAEQERALAEARARVEGLLPEREAEALYLPPGEKEALEAQLRTHREEWAEVEARLRALPPAPPLSLEEAEARVQQAQKVLEESRKALEDLKRREAVLEERLRGLERDLDRRRELEGRLAQVAQEVALWEKLALDLQRHNFPTYLLGLRQQHLVARADELLHTLSGGRYRLRARGSEYAVLDLWTDAERPVKTLSGGESFLASLALALALSEELSQGRLGALFLDEGFGTLDPETLELVAGVLESLPTRGRLVGIVTHVEALAERLPARLRVRKHLSGSRVEWA
ncbi:MAG: SMC family ATPase [Thermus sp.]|uniref:AAA family ATPase n=1 Tax=Thermus sp. TaxID=275 RepID=UPI0025D99CA1|nr:SMC family ATPase [Thermus sp.]MCS6868412.1 SMC family ATPase [Thermus sp.]MCS7218028.1 SMC family ATPase [Thermus sp.]MDW8357756.1 SMC family ATPase [Thermus sp.]